MPASMKIGGRLHRVRLMIDTWRTAQRLLCGIYGHDPLRDMCGRPDHDYCAWCHTSMPGQARPAGMQ